jgi:hypothetical protein
MAISRNNYSPEVAKLAAILSQKPEGVLLTHEEITDLMGYDAQSEKGRCIINQAMQKLWNQKITIKRVWGMGVVRVSAAGAAHYAKRESFNTIERGAKKGLKKFAAVRLSDVPQEDQVEAISAVMTLKMASNAVSDTSQSVLMEEVKAAGVKELDVMSTTLKMLASNR